MFTNYLKSAWRTLWKDRYYALINVLGLAVSTAVFLLLVHFVRFEYSYENFIEKADDLYRITLDNYNGSEYIDTDCETYPPLGPFLKQEMPEVLDFTRIQMLEDNNEIQYMHRAFRIEHIYAVDPSTFSMFEMPFVNGNADTFDQPYKLVLSETEAKRIFGSENPIGKALKQENTLYTVTGVFQDSPANTHLKFDMLVSFSSLKALGWTMDDNWGGNNNYLYVRLPPKTDVNTFNKKLHALTKSNLSGKITNLFNAEPIKSIHLYSHKFFEPEVNGDVKTVNFLAVIALLILLVGSVNYVNLTTARASERVKEIGMRKLLGSSKGLLICQLLLETLIINLIAMGFSVLLISIASPFYRQLIGQNIPVNLFGTEFFWSSIVLLLLFNCFLSGVYPAFQLATTKPIKVVSRVFTTDKNGNFFRKALIIGQFIAAMVVLSATLIVFQQLNFLKKQDIGLNPSELLVIRGPKTGTDSLRREKGLTFKNKLLTLSEVEKVTLSDAVPTALYDVSTSVGITRYGATDGNRYNYTLYGIDEDFIPTNDIKLAAGENFKKGTKNENKLLINETAARLLGFENATSAIGQAIDLWGNKWFVVGVTKDFHQLSLKEAMLPMVHWYSTRSDFVTVKLQTKHIAKSLQTIEKEWKAVYPEYPLNYHFMNELLDQQYQSDRRFGKVVGVFSVLVLLITSLGVLGLTTYTIHKRTKEIGIRKILGASVPTIFGLLSVDFVKLIALALVLAVPITWYVMNSWLENYALHIQVQWWVFGLVGVFAIGITLLVLSYQTVKAAMMNPVESLRAE
ncbi:ABC transporter permease [Olivibacter sp. CPCC 100613]|uniref:ABC transporter permease n=1 Tax=Olivibacter sp. CPCC 100613 TaxID=3079931 RepID=UPI002FFCB316